MQTISQILPALALLVFIGAGCAGNTRPSTTADQIPKTDPSATPTSKAVSPDATIDELLKNAEAEETNEAAVEKDSSALSADTTEANAFTTINYDSGK